MVKTHSRKSLYLNLIRNVSLSVRVLRITNPGDESCRNIQTKERYDYIWIQEFDLCVNYMCILHFRNLLVLFLSSYLDSYHGATEILHSLLSCL